MEDDDSALWSRSRAGDAAAFGLLFERHANAIYNYCFRRTGDWAGAEDLLSVVFLEAWRQRAKVLPPGKVLPWLFGIATNVVRNERRSERRHTAALRRMPRPRADDRAVELTDARLDEQRQMTRVLALIERLSRGEQEVFVLCGWFDLSYEDAAVALEIPVGTVRSRLSRARARLRELDASFEREEHDSHDPAQEAAES